MQTAEGSRTQRSFVSERLRAVPASGIRKFFDLLSRMDDVISLGVGEPDFVTPAPFREAAIRSIEEGHTHYTSNFGMFPLREALAAHLDGLYGVSYRPQDELLITAGVSEALDIAMRAVLDPGDEVICSDPCYVAYMPAVALAGGRFVTVPTYAENDFQLNPADVEAAITERTKVILLGYPSNPTGAVMPREKLMAIAEVAERHDLLVISDEIYDRLVYDMEHTSFPSLEGMQERTVLLGGFSKAYAMTGWRLGYVAAPAAVLEAIMKVHQYVMMSAPTAAQYAALEALQTGEPYVQEMVAEYNRRRRLMVDGFRAIGFDTFEPRGAFYAFPSVSSTGMSSIVFAERLLEEERVAVIPGTAFGPGGEGYVRACYANSYELIESALERVGRFARRHLNGHR